MNIFAIYACATDDEPIVRTMADGPEEAMELVRQNAWVCQQLTSDACAFEVEEVVEP